MKYCLVADDGQARVVVAECDNVHRMRQEAEIVSVDFAGMLSTAKFHVCRREPSANGENLVTIETWEKGVKL